MTVSPVSLQTVFLQSARVDCGLGQPIQFPSIQSVCRGEGNSNEIATQYRNRRQKRPYYDPGPLTDHNPTFMDGPSDNTVGEGVFQRFRYPRLP